MTELIKTSPPEQLNIPFLESEIKFNGIKIKSAEIKVTHGSGIASGDNWISLTLDLVNDNKITAGGYKLIDGEFYSLIGKKSNTEENLNQPIFSKLETYLKENPEKLTKIKEELNK